MLTFIKDILPKITRYSKKLDDLTMLTNQHWVYVDKNSTSKIVFIFRSNSNLIISINGRAEIGRWSYLGNDYLLVEKPSGNHLYKHGFFDDTILALKVDGTLDFAFFINETKIGKELNNIENILTYLDRRYISHIFYPDIGDSAPVFTEELNPGLHENGKWCYYNLEGQVAIPAIYDSAYRFTDDLAIVIVSGKYGMIDKKGSYVIFPKYEFLEPFSEGLALARLNRKFGFIDKNGKTKIDFAYDYADSFESGRAKVRINDQVKFISK